MNILNQIKIVARKCNDKTISSNGTVNIDRELLKEIYIQLGGKASEFPYAPDF